MAAEFLALITALSYAAANVSARWGLRYSTPNTATFISLLMHAIVLPGALLPAGGVPVVPRLAFFLVLLTGVLQVLLRFCHYTAIARVGVSRAVTLRNTYPILSVLIGVVALGERTSPVNLAGVLLIVVGTGFTSWRMQESVPSFRFWYLVFPVATAMLTAAVHPLRRFALTIADEPLFFAAVVGVISFAGFSGYLALPLERERIQWHRRAVVPFFVSGTFETMGILFLFYAFASGPVVIVSPIAATSPIWTVILTGIVLRDVERINLPVVLGTVFVVVGAILVTVGRYW